jgi:integrase
MNLPTTYPLRAGSLTIGELIDLYMAQYDGRDTTRVQRLTWWRSKLGTVTLDEVNDDHVHLAIEALKTEPARYFAGRDAYGQPIYKAKKRQLSGATINRILNAFAGVCTWAFKRRIAPKGWVHPCRGVERHPEGQGRTRFLSPDERTRLLAACKGARWPKMYALVLLALTTGARKGELLGLRWQSVDFEQCLLHIPTTKNGDPKALPLTPAAVAELRRLQGPSTKLVFESTRSPGNAFGFEPEWKELLKACGIRNFRFHDLRHSCASMLAANGATLLEIGDLLGHRQVSMTKRYSHLAAGHRSALVHRVMREVQ